jgi:hypothetical protein
LSRQIEFNRDVIPDGMDFWVEDAENLHPESLQAQKEKSEKGFAAGLGTPWEFVKLQNGL